MTQYCYNVDKNFKRVYLIDDDDRFKIISCLSDDL